MLYKRNFITAEQNAEQIQFNHEYGLYHSILRESSPVDEFYREPTKSAHDDIESVSYVDPIIILFNQDRLQSLGDMGVKAFLDSLQQRESSLAELRKKVSDDDLCAMMKSRYLQTPSEVTSWCRYIEGNVDAFNKEVQALLDAQKQQQTTEPIVESQNVT